MFTSNLVPDNKSAFVTFFEVGDLRLIHLDGRVKNRTVKLGETNTFTKVVTQMVQFLSDSRAGDRVVEHDNVLDEEEMEFSESSEG